MSKNKNKDKVIKPSISMVWGYIDNTSKTFIVAVGIVLVILLVGALVFKLTINLPMYISTVIMSGVILGVLSLICIVKIAISIIKDIKLSYKCALRSSSD